MPMDSIPQKTMIAVKTSISQMITTVLFVMVLCGCGLTKTHGMTDKATSISFPSTMNKLEIFGVGTRRKGPINVYSVGMYSSSQAKAKLAGYSRSSDEKRALAALQKIAKDNTTAFVLKMALKVGAEKMASAIAESVAPRHTGNMGDVDKLKQMIFKGVEAKGAATKGTTFQFNCTNEGISVSVDGEAQGSVASPGLSSAFCDVYLDEKCVSPPLRKSCIQNCCSP